MTTALLVAAVVIALAWLLRRGCGLCPRCGRYCTDEEECRRNREEE